MQPNTDTISFPQQRPLALSPTVASPVVGKVYSLHGKICHYCKSDVLSRRTNAATCGKPNCVKAHKRRLRDLLNIKHRNNGMAKYWRHDKCFCGREKVKGSSVCKVCMSAINSGVSFLAWIKKQKPLNKQIGLLSKCTLCESEYIKKTPHQKYCSDPCKQRGKKINNPDVYKQCIKRSNEKQAKKPEYKLSRNIRRRILEALHGKSKSKPTFDMLGYTPEELVSHIQQLFEFGMTWDNYGQWHVDHIKPVSMHRLKTPRDFAKCWSLKNLRPRWATTKISNKYGGFHEGNINKGNRYVG
jgi:hypothetical protein